MINPKNKLTVVHFDGASYTDFSRKAASFGRDSFTITLETDDYLYIGYEKAVNALYTNLITVNTNTSVYTLEYWNGTSWTEVDSFDDDSEGHTRSAFFQWDRNLEDEEEVIPDVSMPEKIYYRLSTDADTTAMEIQGMNLIFADDDDLKKEFFCILDGEILQGATSHILIHEAARDEITQQFRNRGFNKRRAGNLGGREDIIPWDLLEIQEVRNAARYLALHKIFFNMSDSPDDVWNQKSLYYRQQYEGQITVANLTLDDNNDGIVTDNERSKKIKHDRVTR